jgi:hypothetical protein
MIHVSPQYHGYKGGFDSITKCVSCGRTALYEDQHTVHPCPNCGADVKEDGAAKWHKKPQKWLKPEEALKFTDNENHEKAVKPPNVEYTDDSESIKTSFLSKAVIYAICIIIGITIGLMIPG